MPNDYLDKINLNGTVYDIKDTISGYVSDVKVDGTSIVSGGLANLVTNTAYDASSNKLATMADVGSMGGGTVTSVGLTNASNGGLTISGSPVTSSGNITVGHTNVLANAQTTSGVYPIKIDKNGHITEYGSAVTIPAAANDGELKLQKDNGTATKIYSANQSSDSTLKFTTTSIGSASGWSAGSTPSLGTPITATDISNWSANTPTSIDVSKFSGGSFTQGQDSFTANTPTVLDLSKFAGGSFTRGTFSGGSFTQGTDVLTMTGGGNSAATASTLSISFSQGADSFTAATHNADSFTPASFGNGAYTQGTAASFSQGSDQFSAASLASGFYSAGSAASLTYASRSIPNVTSVGSTPSLTVTSSTVVNDISNV